MIRFNTLVRDGKDILWNGSFLPLKNHIHGPVPLSLSFFFSTDIF